jgi:ABC-type uncharacterized transport system substrate-binding protein
MNRRKFCGVAAAFFGARPFATRAQPAKIPRIGFLGNGRAAPTSAQDQAFRRGLSDLGWIDGQNVTIEYRWAEGIPERLPGLIAELVQLKVDVLFVAGGPAIRAARSATSTIPIVFVLLTDPIGLGNVQSLAHPGGNMTGLASQFEELITKQLQLLKEAVPDLANVGLLYQSIAPPAMLTAAEAAARSLGLASQRLAVSGAIGENTFKAARNAHAGAILVFPSPYFDAQHARLIELAAKYRLPACYEFNNYVRDGGFMSYGPDINEMFARSAGYINQILKGANAGELPIERPTRFELVINLKTAAALGLTVPPSLLQRADEVIR